MNKHRKLILAAAILGFYLIAGIFVSYILKNADNTVKVDVKEERVADDDAETHPAKAYLTIDYGYYKQDYYARLTDTTEFTSMLDYLKTTEGFSYETTNYIYGVGFDSINKVAPLEGFIWKVYDNGEDITYKIGDLKIRNEHQYVIRIEAQQ